MAHDKPRAAVHTVSLKLPPFWQDDPALWFHQVEAQFATKGITQQLTKYNYIVSSLAPEIGREVRDVIVTVPADAPFDTLKERLVSRTSLTESQRMQKLLSLQPLGDQKTSQLLRRIEQLADKTGNDNPILQEIFLTRLPVAVQLVLKSHPEKSTEQLASLADSLVAVIPEASLPWSFSTIAPVAANIDTIASLRSELEDLKFQFSLQQKTGKFSPPSTTSPSVTLCWYHARFGKDATKCKKPCSMSGNAFPAH